MSNPTDSIDQTLEEMIESIPDDVRKLVKKWYDPKTEHNCENEVYCRFNVECDIVRLIQAARAETYLSHFSYVDWDTGDDDKLRVGDLVNIVHQEPSTGSETITKVKIILHDNGVPVFLTEPDSDDGDYWDIQTAYMSGNEFARLEALNNIGDK